MAVHSSTDYTKDGWAAKTECSTSSPQGHGPDLTTAPGSGQSQARMQNEVPNDETTALNLPKNYKAPAPQKYRSQAPYRPQN
ncbi:hypothetical protein SK128_024221, partial [Halocaridina rubra]